MMKKIVAATAMLFAFACWAAVDVNKASEEELQAIKGVGPALSKRILDARAEGAFKDWPDLMARVNGVKDKSASKLSAEGLTVNGRAFGEPAAGAAASAVKSEPAQKKAAASAAPAAPTTAPTAAAAATPKAAAKP